MADNNGSNSATTVLIAVIIMVVIGAAFYFGFVRGNWADGFGNDAPNGVNVELNTPDGGGGNNGGIQY